MARMNSFIVENIETVNEKEIVIKIRVGQSVKSFNIILQNHNSVSVPENLELLLLNKDFDYHREFFKIISNHRLGIDNKFPITLFDRNKLKKQELQAA